MALIQTNNTPPCSVNQHLLTILMVATGFNIYFYVTNVVQLAQYYTPQTESIGSSFFSYFCQFNSDILTITIFIAWEIHTLIYESASPDRSLYRLVSGKPLSYTLLFTTLLFTMYLVQNKFKLLLLVTYKVGVMKQDPIYQRIFEYTYSIPEDGLSLVCTLGWLIVAFCRIRQLHSGKN